MPVLRVPPPAQASAAPPHGPLAHVRPPSSAAVAAVAAAAVAAVAAPPIQHDPALLTVAGLSAYDLGHDQDRKAPSCMHAKLGLARDPWEP